MFPWAQLVSWRAPTLVRAIRACGLACVRLYRVCRAACVGIFKNKYYSYLSLTRVCPSVCLIFLSYTHTITPFLSPSLSLLPFHFISLLFLLSLLLITSGLHYHCDSFLIIVISHLFLFFLFYFSLLISYVKHMPI